MGFWTKLEQAMKERRLTPYRIAKDTGISNSTFSRWKNDGIVPDAETLQKLANYLNISTDFLLGREDKETEARTSELLADDTLIVRTLLADPEADVPEGFGDELRRYAAMRVAQIEAEKRRKEK